MLSGKGERRKLMRERERETEEKGGGGGGGGGREGEKFTNNTRYL